MNLSARHLEIYLENYRVPVTLKMDNDEELPEILAQINDNWNIQNVQHIFDGNTF